MNLNLSNMVLSKRRAAVALKIILLSPVLCSKQPVTAQESLQNQWQGLVAADARLRASRITWRRDFIVPPKPQADAEKTIAQAIEKARQQGKNDAEVQEAERTAQRNIKLDAEGYKRSDLVSFLHSSSKTLRSVADQSVQDSTIHEGNSAEKALLPKTIYLYDGKDFVSLSKHSINGAPMMLGVLMRNGVSPHNLEPHFFSLPLLAGASITKIFSERESSLQEGTNNTLILQRRVKRQGFSLLLRLIIAKGNMRPVSYEEINMADNKVLARSTASDYRRYANGIWFPTQVQISFGTVWTEKYSLVSAEFNEAVDPAELRLPPQTEVADSRFGEDGNQTVKYTVKNGLIPSDDEIRKMLGQKQAEAKAAGQVAAEAKDEETKQSPIAPVTPALGLLLMAVACIMWVRSSHYEER